MNSTKYSTRASRSNTGTFTLSFQGYETDPIAFDASPEEMQERLEALASVETVEVTRSNGAITNPGGFVWDVTFTSDSNAADQDRIQSDDSSLEGVGKTIDIVETLKGSQVDGNFTLSYDGNESIPLNYDISSTDLRDVLDTIGAGHVLVTRSGPSPRREYTWTVSFLDDTESIGDVSELVVDDTNILNNAQMSVTEIRKGMCVCV